MYPSFVPTGEVRIVEAGEWFLSTIGHILCRGSSRGSDRFPIYRKVDPPAPLKRVVFEPTGKPAKAGQWMRNGPELWVQCHADTDGHRDGYTMREEDVPPRDGADLLAGQIATECFHGVAYDGERLVEIIRRHHAAHVAGGGQ